MTDQLTGPFGWPSFKRELPIVFGQQEISTDLDTVASDYRETWPDTASGVQTGQGFVQQSSTPSPKAPFFRGYTFTLRATPQVVEVTHRHYQSIHALSKTGAQLPKLWLPNQLHTHWPRILAGRSRYTMPFFIAGSAGEASIGPSRFVEPLVQVRDNYKVVATLTRMPSSPGVDEYNLTDTTGDHREIFVGDISAHVGLTLEIYCHPLVEVEIQAPEFGLVQPGQWLDALPLVAAPSPFDYETDAGQTS